MSEFKWVPEVGMKFQTELTRGIAMPASEKLSGLGVVEFFDIETSTVHAYPHGWPYTTKPLGKIAEKHYAKAKKEWEDAQVIGVGDWVERVERVETSNSFLSVGDISKCIFNQYGFIRIDGKHSDEKHFTKYFRKLTPAEVEAHEASLVPEFEVGSYWVLLENENHFIQKNALVRIVEPRREEEYVTVQDLSKNKYHHGEWGTEKTNLRPATPEEIKAATRTVHDLDRGDRFFYLTPCGDARPAQWVCSAFDFGARKRGNIFLTRQEAEAEDARRVAANAQDGGGL